MSSKNKKTLDSFVKYCEKNPELRFWQALRNWSGYSFIYAISNVTLPYGTKQLIDTFYFKGRDQ